MKIELWFIGKTAFPFVESGMQEFAKRVKRYNPFEVKCIPDVKSGKKHASSKIKQEEAKKIFQGLKADDLLILLDERGKRYTSIAFSKALEKWQLSSKKRIVFLIGGAWGFDQSVYSRADAQVSLSDMTYSHQLIRLIFLEQLYRGFSIINNEKYHNE